MAITYEEYRTARQEGFNALPIMFAFNMEQFAEGMEKLGLTVDDKDKVCSIGAGGFMRKDDLPLLRAWSGEDKLDDLMKDYDFCKSAVYSEMCNHEYGINWQADFDVMSCFGHIEYTDASDDLIQYFDQLNWSDDQRKAYIDARREYYKAAEEHEWF